MVGAPPASGLQHVLRDGAYEAVIATVGASVRSLTHHGRDLVVPFEANEIRPAYRGATLAPWPNRVIAGRYEFDGVQFELPITEPARGHALHGLLAWQDYATRSYNAKSLVLTTQIVPQAGYPWRVTVTTTYEVGSSGLRQTVQATNESSTEAPWGTGPHPYLIAGPGQVDDWVLELPAQFVMTVLDEWLIPTGLEPVTVDATRFDFRAPRTIGPVELDHAFTGLRRRPGESIVVRVTTRDGSGVVTAFDARCPWVQIHTADRADQLSELGHRRGLAVEPMTCPPDAFNSGTDLIRIQPGRTVEAVWTIAAASSR